MLLDLMQDVISVKEWGEQAKLVNENGRQLAHGGWGPKRGGSLCTGLDSCSSLWGACTNVHACVCRCHLYVLVGTTDIHEHVRHTGVGMCTCTDRGFGAGICRCGMHIGRWQQRVCTCAQMGIGVCHLCVHSPGHGPRICTFVVSAFVWSHMVGEGMCGDGARWSPLCRLCTSRWGVLACVGCTWALVHQWVCT